MVSNRMARFTCKEGFPDPEALFEVQIKAVQGDSVSVKAGTISYGYWCGFLVNTLAMRSVYSGLKPRAHGQDGPPALGRIHNAHQR